MNYSDEDIAHVERILETKNFYEILAVPNDATEEQIRSAHKKLALKVHPDKNNYPRSKEAFIVIRKATAVLLDKTTRKEYDEYLRTPYAYGSEKFDLSEEAVDAILVTAGIVSIVGIAAGLIGLYKWFTSGSKEESRDPRYAK